MLISNKQIIKDKAYDKGVRRGREDYAREVRAYFVTAVECGVLKENFVNAVISEMEFFGHYFPNCS